MTTLFLRNQGNISALSGLRHARTCSAARKESLPHVDGVVTDGLGGIFGYI